MTVNVPPPDACVIDETAVGSVPDVVECEIAKYSVCEVVIAGHVNVYDRASVVLPLLAVEGAENIGRTLFFT